jgi:predicted transcriptional regulator of viral defense system
MGKKKHLDYILGLFDKSPVVDFTSINRAVRSKKKIKQYTKQIIRNLIKQGRIYRIGKGLYTIHKDSSLAVFGFSPSYLGMQDALSFHNLWEQETNALIVTTKKVRVGLRTILGVNAVIKKISPKYMFGFDYYKYPLEDREIYIPYSDIEKTFIDMVYFKQPIDEETLQEFRKRISRKKLREYLKKYPKRFERICLRRFREDKEDNAGNK